jgi:hypothetical protein
MRNLSTLTRALTVAAAVVLPSVSASALPLGPATGGIALTAQLNHSTPTIKVHRRGGGVAAGIIGGMILGGIIASQPRYHDHYYYPPYRYRAYPYDPAVACCMRRFRSYDPYSMTYLGYDGFRHPCP